MKVFSNNSNGLSKIFFFFLKVKELYFLLMLGKLLPRVFSYTCLCYSFQSSASHELEKKVNVELISMLPVWPGVIV